MTQTYKRSFTDFTTTDNTTLYTVPSTRTAIINGFLLTNDSASSTTVDVTLTDADSNVFYIYKSATVAAYAEHQIINNPLIVKEGEIIKAQMANANRVHGLISICELSARGVSNTYTNALKSLTTTDQTPIYTVPDEKFAILDSILVCEIAGNTPTLTTVFNDGTSDFNLNLGTMTANLTSDLLTRGQALQSGDSLRMTSTVADSIDTVVSLLEITPTGG